MGFEIEGQRYTAIRVRTATPDEIEYGVAGGLMSTRDINGDVSYWMAH